MEESYYTAEEKKFVVDAYKKLCESFKDETSAEELKQLRQIMTNGIAKGHAARDKYGINPTVRHLNTALLITENIGADKNMVIAVLLYHLCKTENYGGVHPFRIYHGMPHECVVHSENLCMAVYKKYSVHTLSSAYHST